MKIKFTKEERRFITLIIEDATNAAQKGKDRDTAREGRRLLNQFTAANDTSDLKWKEFCVITSLVETSIEVLEKILNKDVQKNDTVKTNLDFAKTFSPRLAELSELWNQ